jgi:hypothetical protein
LLQIVEIPTQLVNDDHEESDEEALLAAAESMSVSKRQKVE